MRHGLAEARGNTIQDDVDQVMVSHLSIYIKSIDIVPVFLHSTCLFEIPDHVKSPIWLAVVIIVLPDDLLDLLLSSIPMPVSLPPF